MRVGVPPVVLTVRLEGAAAAAVAAVGSPNTPAGLAGERSIVRGVYPVMRKWQRGVGISDATRPSRSLFM